MKECRQSHFHNTDTPRCAGVQHYVAHTTMGVIALLCTLCFASSTNAEEAQLPLVAIHGVEPILGVLNNEEAAALTNAIEEVMLRSGKYRTLSRNKMDRMRLEAEAEHNLSDECSGIKEGDDTVACYIEIGGAAGARLIASAEVSPIGKAWIISVKLLDMVTMETRHIGKAQCEGQMDCLMYAATTATRNMLGITTGQWIEEPSPSPPKAEHRVRSETTMTSTQGFLVVDSEPTGATLLIIGKEYGATPYQAELAAGEYNLLIKKSLWKSATRKVLLAASGKRLRVKLEPDYGVLKVTSKPDGASITINGEPTQAVTPHAFPPKPSGMYQVTLSKDLYFSSESKVVRLGEGKTENVHIVLQPNFGSLEVTSEPPGAEIMLDDERLDGITPKVFEQIPSGTHRAELHIDPQYRPALANVVITPRSRTKLHLDLVGKYGQLVAMAAMREPDGSVVPVEAEALVDGVSIGTTPLKHKLLEGEHTLELRLATITPRSKAFAITEGQRTDVQEVLKRSGSGLNNSYIPKDLGLALLPLPSEPDFLKEYTEHEEFDLGFSVGLFVSVSISSYFPVICLTLLGFYIAESDSTSYYVVSAGISVALGVIVGIVDGSGSVMIKEDDPTAVAENERRRQSWEEEHERVDTHNANVMDRVREANK
ncbi:MAG: PEGA domain-containing protein [Candidatus Uhrbacteria bacterium]